MKLKNKINQENDKNKKKVTIKKIRIKSGLNIK